MMIVEYLSNVLKQTFFLLSLGVVPYLLIAVIMQFCSGMLRRRLASLTGVRLYIFLTAPGVAVHELSHAFFCLVFRHRIVEMKLFSPQADGTLGYVNHSYDPSNRFQRIGNFFIGTGPIWGGVFILWLLSILLLPGRIYSADGAFADFLRAIFSISFWGRWQSWLWLYLFLSIGSHITLSPPDIKGAADGILVLIASVLIFELLFAWNESVNDHCLQVLIFLLRDMLGPVVMTVCIMLFGSLILKGVRH